MKTLKSILLVAVVMVVLMMLSLPAFAQGVAGTVSYTHLDVYKRQASFLSSNRRGLFKKRWVRE